MKWTQQKRHYREYKARVEQLPQSYRAAVAALERYINYFGGLDDGDSILTMVDDLADLFEQAAADGTPVREIVGDDPVEFIDAFLSNYPQSQWVTRERERLTRDIALAAGEGP